MIQTTIKAMEPHIRQRFHFATSAFSRIFGVPHVTARMVDFCYNWAMTEETAPLDCLNHTDRYFIHLWDTSQQQH